jgi:hypothetical protein
MAKVLRFNDFNFVLLHFLISQTEYTCFFARSIELKQFWIMDFIDENGLIGMIFFLFWVFCFGFFNQLCVLDFPLYQVILGRVEMWKI